MSLQLYQNASQGPRKPELMEWDLKAEVRELGGGCRRHQSESRTGYFDNVEAVRYLKDEYDPVSKAPLPKADWSGITVSPNPFRSRATICPGSLGQPDRVRVFSGNGELVRTLGSMNWDGRNKAGRQAEPGRYYIILEKRQQQITVPVVYIK